MNEAKHEPTPGEQLRKALVGSGSNRTILATPYNELSVNIRETHEQIAAEFLAPYLARIAELEATIKQMEENDYDRMMEAKEEYD